MGSDRVFRQARGSWWGEGLGMERGSVGMRFLNEEWFLGQEGGSCQWVKGFLGKKRVLGKEECSWVGRGFLGREGVLGSKGVHRKGEGSWMRRVFKLRKGFLSGERLLGGAAGFLDRKGLLWQVLGSWRVLLNNINFFFFREERGWKGILARQSQERHKVKASLKHG